jgi:hypothetical protein
MTQLSDSIFNERGVLRTDLENVRVPPERRGVFDALVSAVMASEEAERILKIKDDAVAAAVKAHDRAVAACPQSTFMDEWRSATRQYREDHHQISLRETWPPETATMPVDEAADDKGDFRPQPVAVLLEALQQAVTALDVARQEVRQARDAVATARQNVAKRLAEYNAATPTITAEQNTRDWIAANNAERARRAAANGGKFQPTLTQTAKAMSGGGYGNDIRTRRGGGAAYRRGPGGVQAFTKAQAMDITAQRIRAVRAAEAGPPRPKLPSER